MHITSARDATTLTFGAVRRSVPRGYPEYLSVELDGPVRATLEAYDNHLELLPDYFRDVAQHWRGWTGTKEWQSVEKDLSFSARSDGRGHVWLTVALRPCVHPDEHQWRAEATLLLEASQLDPLAEQVANHLAIVEGAA